MPVSLTEKHHIHFNIIVLYVQIFNKQLFPFQNLSLGIILKIFLKFRKFQLRYSYKIYSYKNECTSTTLKIKQIQDDYVGVSYSPKLSTVSTRRSIRWNILKAFF